MHVKLICITFAFRELRLPTPCVAVGGSFLLHSSPNDGSGKQNFHLFPANWDVHSERHLQVCHDTGVWASPAGVPRHGRQFGRDRQLIRIYHLYNIHQLYSGCRDIATPSFKYLNSLKSIYLKWAAKIKAIDRASTSFVCDEHYMYRSSLLKNQSV